jgi:hypothetical protein
MINRLLNSLAADRYERRRLAESAIKRAMVQAYRRGWQDKEEGVERNAERGIEAGERDMSDAMRLLGG